MVGRRGPQGRRGHGWGGRSYTCWGGATRGGGATYQCLEMRRTRSQASFLCVKVKLVVLLVLEELEALVGVVNRGQVEGGGVEVWRCGMDI